ncbi:MAG: hypothetical protein CBC55_00815 [Gammaproteobacteria bacterium TMED95]|uniref:Uncharacterized protein n=1 Tax=Alteromonas mediterranea TaxID=314275 RepID=A0AAC9JEJ5_9ALTE|nr:hypothetical protein [Alteromonas mediterranea]APD92169.1 hypothetical protein BM524_19815 [Alteromonas mediterranea]APE00024.1 hypothetical protein BM525_20010 [Alteromonas mediterranea]OUV23562.1 MAG: hypothetical protein CBC55_00815 [Gammaproteobacteria bacterium TMED95]|tara:strand:+ start:19175 stop:20143 length:969 start_codon:yes stop_codon:yes gene_type:complete
MASVKGSTYFIVDEGGVALSEIPSLGVADIVNASARKAIMGDDHATLREVMISIQDPSDALEEVNATQKRNLKAVPFLEYLTENKDNVWMLESLPLPLNLINDIKLMDAMEEVASSEHTYIEKKHLLKATFKSMTNESLPESIAISMLRKARSEWFGKVGDWTRDFSANTSPDIVANAMANLLEQKKARGTINNGFMRHIANNITRFSEAATPEESAQRMLSISMVLRKRHGADISTMLKHVIGNAEGTEPHNNKLVEKPHTGQLRALTDIISEMPASEKLHATLDIVSRVEDDQVDDITFEIHDASESTLEQGLSVKAGFH